MFNKWECSVVQVPQWDSAGVEGKAMHPSTFIAKDASET